MKKVYYLDALFYSLMVGAGETYFTAFSLRLGHSPLQAGMLGSLPLAIGGMVQTFVPYCMQRMNGPKNWTVIGAILQGLIFLLLFSSLHIATDFFSNHYAWLFLLVSLYWIFNLGISPSWSAWIAELIPEKEQTYFFRVRNTITGIGSLTGLVSSGLALHYGSEFMPALVVFKYLFLICFGYRTASSIFLMLYPRVSTSNYQAPSLNLQFFRFPEEYNYLKRIAWFTAIFKLGVYFSASFFSPYMLKAINLNYIQYMCILSSGLIGRVFFLRLFKHQIARVDINKLYFMAALGVSLLPFMWTFSSRFQYLFLLEIGTGIAWGGVELSFTLISFKQAPAKFQPYYMSYFNLIHTMAITVGVLLGSGFFYYTNQSVAGVELYHQVFTISSVLRFSALIFFPGVQPLRAKFSVRYLLRIVGIRPHSGAIERPIALWSRGSSADEAKKSDET